MKQLCFAFFLATACGDNIKPAGGGDKWIDDTASEPDGLDGESTDGEDTRPDAGGRPERDAQCDDDDSDSDTYESCDDSHFDLNGHCHKEQHDQDLPPKP